MQYRDEFDYGSILLDLGISEEGTAAKIPASRQRELFGYVPFGKQTVSSYFQKGVGYEFCVSVYVAFGMDSNVRTFSPKELIEALKAKKDLRA